MSSKTSISDNNLYPKFCQIACENYDVFKNFRRHQVYNEILEHVSYSQGLQYLDFIKKHYSDFLQNEFLLKFLENDKIGNPVVYDYGFGSISPTTLRYIKVLGDLHKNFGDLNGADIVEIGGGYGGQAKIILDTYNISSYTIFDLSSALSLTEKYLLETKTNINNVNFKTLENYHDNKVYDLLISNYALTECTKEVQNQYIEKLVNKSNCGYITANFINHLFNLDYFTKEELLNIIKNSKEYPEEPNTFDGNVVIIWK